VRLLADDLPRLWQAPTTTAKERKRVLRLLLKDWRVKGSHQKSSSQPPFFFGQANR